MVTLHEAVGLGDPPASDVLELADALERLAKVDDRLSQGIELFYFGGLTYDEIPEALRSLCRCTRWRAASWWAPPSI